MLEKIYFITEDNVKLVGLLNKVLSSDEVIISVHGFSSNCLTEREDIFSKQASKNNISYFTFNNRGHDFMSRMNKFEKKKYIQGSCFEDIFDSYYDICAAIKEMQNLGYTKIHLQGHSLGCTKIVYTYNKLKQSNKMQILNSVKSIILLSLVDIVGIQKYSLKDKYDEYLNYAVDQEKQNNLDNLMPYKDLELPMSVKTYLRYFRDNEDINFARYSDINYEYEKLNNINIPLFIRWGNINEMIIQNADDLVLMLKSKIKNKKLDIGYIDNANHNYFNKEKILADEINLFIKKI
ncbi:MAG: hypothetical protein RR144_04200 [Clostridia bacterium]